MNSAIYTGNIFHQRFQPIEHHFNYKIFMAYIDLDEIDSLMPRSFFWGVNRPALISFFSKDYLSEGKLDLRSAVKNLVLERTGKDVQGPVRLLTHLRYFGYCFNPVSFYYCFDKAGEEVETIIAEVTNTPWKERHSYVIQTKNGRNKQNGIEDHQSKKLHVSPFFQMDHQYRFLFSDPREHLSVEIENFKNRKKIHEALLNLRKLEFNKAQLIKTVGQFPFITFRVVSAIHWQAVKLWLKGATFYPNPRRPETI
ncbi:MAG: DUF1365 domain-containing protein [Candidatus Marinimicrobia bacterium]|nr:DUF1365 domain-containing protein [Candidatus Neomarinimicrobiota bacterium]|tara:strand:- start:37403 stop:38164 length:762 start_codon:yes stop_codon:yes gene_type:complete